jgi:hypothetical protein
MDLPFLRDYAGQTTTELLALDQTYRTDSIVLRFEEGLGQKAARLGDDALSTPERVVLVIEAVERAVNSDGYWGLFANEAEYVPDVVSALEAIGAGTAADLTGQAIDELRIDERLTAEAVELAIAHDDEARDARLDDLGQQYYEKVGDLSEPLLVYIRENRDQIILP